MGDHHELQFDLGRLLYEAQIQEKNNKIKIQKYIPKLDEYINNNNNNIFPIKNIDLDKIPEYFKISNCKSNNSFIKALIFYITLFYNNKNKISKAFENEHDVDNNILENFVNYTKESIKTLTETEQLFVIKFIKHYFIKKNNEIIFINNYNDADDDTDDEYYYVNDFITILFKNGFNKELIIKNFSK